MTLRKAVDSRGHRYRIFEFSPSVFHVLNSEGRTVDEFSVVEVGVDPGPSVMQAHRQKRLRPGVPDLARAFVSELNAARARA